LCVVAQEATAKTASTAQARMKSGYFMGVNYFSHSPAQKQVASQLSAHG
jgi:hypothetical protein